MRPISCTILLTLLSPNALPQCCGGRQDTSATSPDGRFMVRTETKMAFSELYCFRFYERTATGAYKECSSVMVQFSSHTHFGVCVSPTGNGFLIRTGLQEGILMYGRDGRRMHTCSPPPGSWMNFGNPDATGLFLAGKVRSRNSKVRHVRIFVPTGRIVGGPLADGRSVSWLRRMLHWDPRREARDAEAVHDAIRQLRRGFADRWRAAERVLITSGLSARRALIAALETRPSERIELVLDKIDKLLCGHARPHPDLDLLCALTKHPNLELSAEARSRLRRILPSGSVPTIEWVREHRKSLQWNAATQVYLRAEVRTAP